jgi:hypothetical protein
VTELMTGQFCYRRDLLLLLTPFTTSFLQVLIQTRGGPNSSITRLGRSSHAIIMSSGSPAGGSASGGRPRSRSQSPVSNPPESVTSSLSLSYGVEFFFFIIRSNFVLQQSNCEDSTQRRKGLVANRVPKSEDHSEDLRPHQIRERYLAHLSPLN